jgi:hypothetical protein
VLVLLQVVAVLQVVGMFQMSLCSLGAISKIRTLPHKEQKNHKE